MMQKTWTVLRFAAPLGLITFSFSFSQIPIFLTSNEIRALFAQVFTQIAIGFADALINLAVFAGFGLV